MRLEQQKNRCIKVIFRIAQTEGARPGPMRQASEKRAPHKEIMRPGNPGSVPPDSGAVCTGHRTAFEEQSVPSSAGCG